MSRSTLTASAPEMPTTQPQLAYRCPVCWKDIEQTQHGYIALHFDSVDLDVCPTKGEPFSIAEPYFAAVPLHTGRRRPNRERPGWHRRRPALAVVA